MTISRRDLCRAGAVAGAAALLPKRLLDAQVDVSIGQAPAVLDDALSSFSRSTFQKRVEGSFMVWGRGRRPVTLRLMVVGDTPTAVEAGTEGSEDCFLASFSGPSWAPLGQDTYSVTHRELGTFRLFLVPAGRPGKSLWYDATFNRVVPS